MNKINDGSRDFINMKLRIALISMFAAILISCNNTRVPEPTPNPDGGGSVSLKVYVPKSSISTYAGEDATTYENHIDTLFVDLYQGGTLIDQSKFSGTQLSVMTNTNDSIVNVGYEVDNITTGALTVKVYANRNYVKPITGEIALPAGDASTSFLMSGEGSLTKNVSTGNYEGTVHVVRDVAKLRINISKHANCLPSDLVIDYANVKIQAMTVANQTSLFQQAANVAAAQAGFAYIDYAERGGAALRHSSTFSATTGGQIDSLYLNENLRSPYSTSNETAIKITVPTTSVTTGSKTDTYTYTLYTNSTYDIKRNSIYTLDIQVLGQSLDPVITLDILPWNDVPVDATIHGTYLTLDKDLIVFDANGNATVNFCTDAQALYFDYTDYNNSNTNAIGVDVIPDGIEDANAVTQQAGYQGQIILDQQQCSSFGFHLASGVSAGSGKICLKAGNIIKCLSIAASKTLDAHFIVGDDLMESGDTYTKAVVTTENGGTWLEVSKDRLYTSNATQNYSGAAVPLYLHLDENLTGSSRSGKISVVKNGSEKFLYITQLPALYVGRFGFATTDPGMGDPIGGGYYFYKLYTEQLCEHNNATHPTPKYKLTDDTSIPSDNVLFNGRAFPVNHFDATNYNSGFNYVNSSYQAMNYCAYKNRDENKNGTIGSEEIKWFLPAQAQLMAMWISYNGYWNVSTSNFSNDTYWSATNNEDYPNQAQYLNFNYGNVGHYYRTQKYWARCVRTGSTNAIEPTMVSIYNTADTKIDFSIGMPSGSYSTISKGDGTGNELSTVNETVYQTLLVHDMDQVAVNMSWSDAKLSCANMGTGWRLPTQRELQAIFVLQNEMYSLSGGFILLSDSYYWSATESSLYPNNAWVVWGRTTKAGSAGNTPNLIKTSTLPHVRCVKEL